jgi:hypothetical protein
MALAQAAADTVTCIQTVCPDGRMPCAHSVFWKSIRKTACMGIYRPRAWVFTDSMHGYLPTPCMGIYRQHARVFTDRVHWYLPTACMGIYRQHAWVFTESMHMHMVLPYMGYNCCIEERKRDEKTSVVD